MEVTSTHSLLWCPAQRMCLLFSATGTFPVGPAEPWQMPTVLHQDLACQRSLSRRDQTGGKAITGWGAVDEVAMCRVPSDAAGAGEGIGYLGRPHQSRQRQTCNKPSWVLPRASSWASSWRSDEKLETVPPRRFLFSIEHSLVIIQCSMAEQRPLLSTEGEAHGKEQGLSGWT